MSSSGYRGGGGGGRGRGGRGGRGGSRTFSFARAGTNVDEEFRLAVMKALAEFRASDDNDVTFPSTLTNVERQFVHAAVAQLGLASKSFGKGENRALRVSRQGGGVGGSTKAKTSLVAAPPLILSPAVDQIVAEAAALSASDLSTHPRSPAGGFGVREIVAALSDRAEGYVGGSTRVNRGDSDSSVVVAAAGAPPSGSPAAAAADVDWRQRSAARKALSDWPSIMEARRSLPSWRAREAVLAAAASSQIVIVSGDTGCGKSTQVPQFLLDNETNGALVNIIVTQPRRVAAISLAERVAWERGESIGDGVGYNVRLESASSAATRLLFCTTGVLLRRLTSGDARGALLAGVTHVVVDEVHERDVHTDFLLVCLRDLLPRRPDLRLVVMSATLQIDLLRGYFCETLTEARKEMMRARARPGCTRVDAIALDAALALSPEPQLVHVEGSAFPVTRFFLEDVLEATGFCGAVAVANSDASLRLAAVVEQARSKDPTAPPAVTWASTPGRNSIQTPSSAASATATVASPPVTLFTCSLCGRLDFLTADDFAEHAGECFGSFPPLPTAVSPPPIVIPSTAAPASSAFAASCALCGRADFEGVNEFAEHAGECFGAPSEEAAPSDIVSPIAFAEHRDEHNDSASGVVSSSSPSASATPVSIDSTRAYSSARSSTLSLPGGAKARAAVVAALPPSATAVERAALLRKYQAGAGDDDGVDVELLTTLIVHIIRGGSREALQGAGAARATATKLDSSPGAILVFLHGWDEISKAMEALRYNPMTSDSSRVLVLPLHSQVASSEQRRVFRRPPPGVTKVILATNIAETSLTIDDVVFVIDTGRVREKTFDAYTGCSSLAPVWVSRASARQRAGRAGRVRAGVSFHLFSDAAHEAMAPFGIPEMLRTPLDELALQIHLLLEAGGGGGGGASPSSRAAGAAAPAAERSAVERFLSRAVQAPETHAVRAALFSLHAMGALRWGGKDGAEALSPLGRALARLPVAPRLGKMLLLGALFQCLDPLLTVAAGMSGRPPWNLPLVPGERWRADKARLTLAGGARSDHMALVGAASKFAEARRRGGGAPFNSSEAAWCRENYVSAGVMNTLAATKKQLLDELAKAGAIASGAGALAAYSRNADNSALVLACLAAGLYPSLARANAPASWTPESSAGARRFAPPPDTSEAEDAAHVPKIETRTKRKLSIHPSSVNAAGNAALVGGIFAGGGVAPPPRRGDSGALAGQPQTQAEWVAYDDMANSGAFGAVSIRGTTVCQPLALLLLAGRCDGAPPEPAPPPPGMPVGQLVGGPSIFETLLAQADLTLAARGAPLSVGALVEEATSVLDTDASAEVTDTGDDDGEDRGGEESSPPARPPPELRVDDFIALTASSYASGTALALLRARFALAFHRTVVFPGIAASAARDGQIPADYATRDSEVVTAIARALTLEAAGLASVVATGTIMPIVENLRSRMAPPPPPRPFAARAATQTRAAPIHVPRPAPPHAPRPAPVIAQRNPAQKTVSLVTQTVRAAPHPHPRGAPPMTHNALAVAAQPPAPSVIAPRPAPRPRAAVHTTSSSTWEATSANIAAPPLLAFAIGAASTSGSSPTGGPSPIAVAPSGAFAAAMARRPPTSAAALFDTARVALG